MSTEKSGSAGRISPARYLWAALIPATIAFAAVYLTTGEPDNANTPDPVKQSAEIAAPAEAGKLNIGQMTAFVFKKTPEPLPELSFQDGAGQTLSLAAFKGKTVVLNLWATWCAPCRKEMPSLDRLQKALGSDKLEVVALSVDRAGIAASKKFLDEAKVENLKLYVDSTAKTGVALKVVGMPTTILVDPEGREIGRLTGPAEWDSAEAQRLISASAK